MAFRFLTRFHRYFFRMPMRNSILCLLLAVFLFSCTSKNGSSPVLPSGAGSNPDKEEVVIHRYEKAIFLLDKKNLRAEMSSLLPEFAFFMGKEWQDTMNILRMYNFLSDPQIQNLYRLETAKFPDVSFLKNGLEGAFGQLRKWYPEKHLPVVYTYISGLDIEMPVLYADTAMVVSMDLFLGSDVTAYVKAGIPEYKIIRFTPDYMLPLCMRAVADSIIRRDESRQTLLDQMISAGKALYFLDVTLPGVKDEYKIGYSRRQLDWCSSNEGNIWAFLIANQLLYSSDSRVVSKLLVDAPFTSGFVAESPGRIGEWVGWNIVRAYMEENPSTSLKELMNNTDGQSILKGSKYKPRKS